CSEHCVTQGFACIPADADTAGLGHKRTQRSDIALHHDIAALERDTTAGRGVAINHEQSAVRGSSSRLGCVALDVYPTGHHVFGNTRASHAGDRQVAFLVHTGTVVSDVAVDFYINFIFDTDAHRVQAARVRNAVTLRGGRMELRVEFSNSALAQINFYSGVS